MTKSILQLRFIAHLKILQFVIVSLFIPTSIFCEETTPSQNVIVLTPQRCGTHWLLYSIRYLTKASPVSGLEENGTLFAGNSQFDVFGEPINRNTYFLIHAHTPNSIIWRGYEQDKLILIIRDYKESILRMFDNFLFIKMAIGKRHNDVIFNDLPPYYAVITWYFENLEYFEQFKGEKLLLYYEELLLQPESVYKNILSFLGASDQFFADFMHDLEFHKETCLNFYNSYRFGSKTHGKDFKFHSKKLKQEELTEFDKLVQNNYPSLWEKYLYRYKETRPVEEYNGEG